MIDVSSLNDILIALQVFTDLNVGSATPNVPTGWEAAAYTSRSFSVPNNWAAGRIWVGLIYLSHTSTLSHPRRLAAIATSLLIPDRTPA